MFTQYISPAIPYSDFRFQIHADSSNLRTDCPLIQPFQYRSNLQIAI